MSKARPTVLLSPINMFWSSNFTPCKYSCLCIKGLHVLKFSSHKPICRCRCWCFLDNTDVSSSRYINRSSWKNFWTRVGVSLCLSKEHVPSSVSTCFCQIICCGICTLFCYSDIWAILSVVGWLRFSFRWTGFTI